MSSLRVAGSDLGPEPPEELLSAATELASRAPQPAQVRNIACGTAGWTDKTLVKGGLFYPRGVTKAEDRLRHYSSHFQLVEVDATYYSLLPRAVSENWVRWTPDWFRFDVKAFPVLTGHPIDVARLPKDLQRSMHRDGLEGRVYPDALSSDLRQELELRFRDFLQPLRSSGKLACVLAQFPPWFPATRGNARRLEALAREWEGFPLAIEFRNSSWLELERRSRVFDLLRRHQLTYVCVDEPDVATAGVPPLLEVTNEQLAVVRFHGHNKAGWQRRGATVWERFNYLYAPQELEQWARPMRSFAARATEVHAVFNNCVRNYAVLNAKGLATVLEQVE